VTPGGDAPQRTRALGCSHAQFWANGGAVHSQLSQLDILKFIAVPLVNIKIAGKWMFIPLKMEIIGIDP
jgi:hypothetical protein